MSYNLPMSSFKGNGNSGGGGGGSSAIAAIDYRSNCSHQSSVPTSSGRFDYNSLQRQTAAAATTSSGDSGTLNNMYQCNDVMCSSNASRLFNRRSLTLMRPPSSTTTMSTLAANTNVSNLYKDQYLRQFPSKLPKLQSFISTPDLTSESSRADDTNCSDELDEQMLALMPPPPPAMPLLTSKTLATKATASATATSTATTTDNASEFAGPDVIQLHTFRCFHHHKHNQATVPTMPSKSTTKESTTISNANTNENSCKHGETESGKV